MKLDLSPNTLYCQIPNWISPETADSWSSAAIANEDAWEERLEGMIYSYGSSWYLDIEAGLLHYYHANAASTNRYLRALPGLIETFTEVGKMLPNPLKIEGIPVVPRSEILGPYWADAGIVMVHGTGDGFPHADYEGLAPYPQALFDSMTHAYSATISVKIPASGGNLRLWPQRALASETISLDAIRPVELQYQVGTLTVFDSFCFHQILSSNLDEAHPFRLVAAAHYLFRYEPEPHWQFWF